MLLCGILIVLGFAHGLEDETLKLTMVEVKLPIELIRWLLWLSAVYYLVGFVMEVRVVRLVNSDAMLGAGMKTVDQSMGKIGAAVLNYEKKLDLHLGEIEKTSERVLKATGKVFVSKEVDAILEGKIRPLNRDVVIDPSVPNIWQGRVAEIKENQEFAVAELRRDAGYLREVFEKAFAEREELQTYIVQTRSALATISRRVSGDRRIAFWGWEIGGAALAFVIATSVNGGHLYWSLADRVQTLTHHRPASVTSPPSPTQIQPLPTKPTVAQSPTGSGPGR